MAKASVEQENTDKGAENATTTPVKKEKAKSGTSYPARAKAAILSLAVTLSKYVDELNAANIVIPEYSEVQEIAKGFVSSQTSTAGLPLAVQIEQTAKALKDLLKTAELIDGEMVFQSETDAAKYESLLAKKKRLHAAHAKENQPVTNPTTEIA